MISNFRDSFQINGFAIVELESLLSKPGDIPDLSLYLDGASKYYSILLFEKDTVHSVDSDECFVKKGECLLVMEGSVHKFRKEREYKGIIILFTSLFFLKHASLETANFICNRRKVLINRAIIYNYPFVDDIVNFISEYSGIEGSYRDSRIGAIFTIYLLKMFEAGVVCRDLENYRSTDKLFIEFNQLLVDNRLESRDAKEYAKEMGISYGILNRVCKRAVNMTPKNCVDYIFTVEAQRLLLVTDLSITKISSALGFNQASNFSKYFKKRVGVLPLKFKDSIYSEGI